MLAHGGGACGGDDGVSQPVVDFLYKEEVAGLSKVEMEKPRQTESQGVVKWWAEGSRDCHVLATRRCKGFLVFLAGSREF